MPLVPSGQVLYKNTVANIEVYAPDPGFTPHAWPQVTTAPARPIPGFTHRLAGTGFNGLSQAVSYGDDASMPVLPQLPAAGVALSPALVSRFGSSPDAELETPSGGFR